MKMIKPLVCLLFLLSVVVGCRDANDSHGHSHDGKSDHNHDAEKAHHALPHGGTPVLIADDKFHLELVLDAAAGKLQAFVLDGHLEDYVQVPETNFLMVAKAGGNTEELSFQRAPEGGSGGVTEKSSMFEARAKSLEKAKEFQGYIPTITLKGKTFTNISFEFPKGSKHVH